MAEQTPSVNAPISNKDAAELASFRANAAREKRIAEIIAERSAICNGAIPESMLRGIAIAQVEADERNAAAETSAKK